jgi:cell division transport system permease protein
MDLRSAFVRARRGFREDAKLYVVAVTSLAVAFLCLGAALVGLANLDAVATRWSRAGRLTVYLADGSTEAEVEQLRGTLAQLPEIASVQHVSAAEAREAFLRDADVSAALGALPADAFPASLEVTLAAGVGAARVDDIAARLVRARGVESVETYRAFFARLESLLLAVKSAAGVLALLVVVCVLAVVGNTIRLAVAGRREEIEVLKLCGATDGYVRGPFMVEGTLQGLAAAALAVGLLFVAFLVIRDRTDDTLAALAGVRAAFLHPAVAAGLVVGGGVAGALGSALSLRRYLAV